MTEERYKRIKDSIELQSLVKKQMGVEDELLQEEIELLKAYEKLKDNWNKLKEHLKNRYDNGTESISYRQVFMEIREAMQVLEIAQELEQKRGEKNG